MTIAQTRDRLAFMQVEIDGITKAFPRAPRVLNVSELPAFVNFAQDATYDRTTKGSAQAIDVRRYEMVLFVSEATDGVEFTAEERAEPFIDRVRDHFLARPGGELDREPDEQVWYHMRILGDSGVTFRRYPTETGKGYLAIAFDVEVQDLIKITYKD